MPKTPQPPFDSPSEMEDRELTEAELTAIGNLTIPPLTARPDPTRDDDYDDGHRPPVATPTIADMQARMEGIMRGIEQQQQQGASGGGSDQIAAAMMMIAEAMNGFRAASLQGAQTIADMQRRTTRPENSFHPMISSFNPRGDKDFPRPKLKCEMFLPWPAESGESMTREEIELLNLLVPGTYTILRVDRTPIKLAVVIATSLDSDVPSRLVIHHETAFNNENHTLMPFDWLRQMVMRHPDLKAQGALILSMEEEEALILARKFNDGSMADAGRQVVSVGA